MSIQKKRSSHQWLVATCCFLSILPAGGLLATAVSAGYDSHRDDPLGGCRVTEAGYAAMTGTLRRLCADLGDVPLGVVLEGGYELAALARSVAATLEVLALEAPPPRREIPVHPLAADAADSVALHWPAVAGVSAG